MKTSSISNINNKYKTNKSYPKNKVFFFNELYSSYTEMISDVIIYVILVCNILTILFFTIVKDIEGEVIKDQLYNILNDVFMESNKNNDINYLQRQSDENMNNIENNEDNNPLKNNINKINDLFENMNNIENNEVNKPLKNNINKINNLFEYITNFKENQTLVLKNKINDISYDKEIENNIKENNNKILKKSIITLLIINITSIAILFGLWKYNNYDFVYYLKKGM